MGPGAAIQILAWEFTYANGQKWCSTLPYLVGNCLVLAASGARGVLDY